MPTKRDLELYELKAGMHKAFADPKRLIIIEELRKGQKSVGDLTRILAIPQAAISRHLAVLRERGVVSSRRESTNVFYTLVDPRICDIVDTMHSLLLSRIEKSRRLVEKAVG